MRSNTKDKLRELKEELWFNYRPLCLVLLFLVLGCVFGFYIHKNMVISIVLFVVIAIIVIFISIWRKKIKYFLIPLIAFAAGVSAYSIVAYQFNKGVTQTPNTIQLRIYSVGQVKNGAVLINGDSCEFDGKKISDNITVNLYDNTNEFENIEIGAVITIKPSKFEHRSIEYNDLPSAYAHGKKLKYFATAKVDTMEYKYTDKTFVEKIKLKIKDNLANGLSNENVEVAYSALFGDKSDMSTTQYSAFRLSGVAHLLAVSGLHVGIVVAVLCKFLSLIRVKRWLKVGVVSVVLTLYMYICGFSVSVVRASIMSIMALLAPLFFRQYDPLSSVSLSGIVLFFINPLYVFDVGALMSFSCVFGIILLAKPIKSILSKTRLPKSVVDGLSISIAVMISLMIIQAYFFKTLNIISIIANVLIVPIFSLIFSVIFVVSFLSLLCPFITYILVLINPILNVVSTLAFIFSNIPYTNLTTINFHYIAIIAFFLLLLVLSPICTAKRTHKTILSISLLALLLTCLL